jgi:uncharacterized membrane protein YdcZ (DUF606 family)
MNPILRQVLSLIGIVITLVTVIMGQILIALWFDGVGYNYTNDTGQRAVQIGSFLVAGLLVFGLWVWGWKRNRPSR